MVEEILHTFWNGFLESIMKMLPLPEGILRWFILILVFTSPFILAFLCFSFTEAFRRRKGLVTVIILFLTTLLYGLVNILMGILLFFISALLIIAAEGIVKTRWKGLVTVIILIAILFSTGLIKWEWIVEWVKQIRWEWIATTMFFYVWVSILISDDEMSKTTELEKMPETSVVCPKCYAMGVRFVVHEVMDRNELMRYSVAYCPNCGFTVITDEKAEYVRHIKNGSREQAKELAKRIREYREFAQKLNLDELVEKLKKTPETSVDCPKCYAMGVRFVVHEVMDRNELMRYSVAYCPNCGFTVITDEKAEYVRHIKNGSREQAKELAKRIREYFQHIRCGEIEMRLNLEELVEELKKMHGTLVACPMCGRPGVKYDVYAETYLGKPISYLVAYCPNCGFTVITDEEAEYICHIKNGSREQAIKLAKRIREYFQHIDNLFEEKMK